MGDEDDGDGGQQHDECQAGGDLEQDNGQDDQREHLTHDVGDQRDDLRKLLRVGGDAADDAAGAVLIEEGEIMADHRLEGLGAQIGDDHARDARQQSAAQPVQTPNEQRGQQRQQRDSPKRGQRRRLAKQVDAFGHDQGLQRADDGQHQQRDQRPGQPAAVAAEIARHAPHQFAVAVGAIIRFAVQACKHASTPFIHSWQRYCDMPRSAPAGPRGCRRRRCGHS